MKKHKEPSEKRSLKTNTITFCMQTITRCCNVAILTGSHQYFQHELYVLINRGYYMPARGYEFYLRVVNSISHSFAALTREISS